jgi:hypothetical protein
MPHRGPLPARKPPRSACPECCPYLRGALHEGLQWLLRGLPESDQDQVILQYFAENPAPPDEYRTPALALQVMRHYRFRQSLPDYEWTVLADPEPLIERPFELPLGVLDINTPIQLPNWPEPRPVKAIHVAWWQKT